MLYKVFKKLVQGPWVPQVVCAESSATHAFCTHACNHPVPVHLAKQKPVEVMRALRDTPQGIRGLPGYGKDLGTKGQEAHSWFSGNLDGLELQDSHVRDLSLLHHKNDRFLGGRCQQSSTCSACCQGTPLADRMQSGALGTTNSRKLISQVSLLWCRGECRRNWGWG